MKNVCPPPHVIPETIVSQINKLSDSLWSQAAILKPLGNKAGEGILYLEPGDRNFNSIVELYAPRKGASHGSDLLTGKGGRQADYPAEWQTNWCSESSFYRE